MKAEKIPRQPSPLERHAAHMMHLGGIPKPQPWFKFMTPERDFEFDFAWPELKVALEIEGLATKRNPKSRHQTWGGYTRDCEKYNLATIRGWKVIRATQKHVETCQFLDWLEPLLGLTPTVRARTQRREPELASLSTKGS